MKKINESFNCIHCGKHIEPARATCRNHCPFCFVSLHVDGPIPGDRNTECHGIMYPISYKILNGDYKILFKCSKCSKEHRNKRASDEDISLLPGLISTYSIKCE